MKTIVYIDGFNLYYRQLKQKPEYRWLNLKKLCDLVLGPQSTVIGIKYYTARVSSKISPDSPRNQNLYLSALSGLPEVSMHFGNFLIGEKWAGLVQPEPNCALFKPWPEVVKIRKIEEKGSDVNLGVHLVRDAFRTQYETAVVLSNDTDLVEPIRIVTEELNLPVGLMSPVSKPAADLEKYASFVKHIRKDHLKKSQFDNPVINNDGKEIHKPKKWEQVIN